MNAVQAERVLQSLAELYPQARPELNFSNPFETLIATILSAQCTDKRVNLVTAKLFPIAPDAFAMAKLSQEQLEDLIRECGLYHSKAKNILAASKALAEEYNGIVPNTREALMRLPGVGQKTAGVVLMAAFGEPQIPVDTHVFRLSHRIGLSQESTPEKVEIELRALLPKESWTFAHHLLIWHGRRMCFARKPNCGGCILSNGLCEKNFNPETE